MYFDKTLSPFFFKLALIYLFAKSAGLKQTTDAHNSSIMDMF